MPTSSQAMILSSTENVQLSKHKLKVFVPCPVSNVDISELLKEAHNNSDNLNSEVRNETSKQTKVVKIQGYRTLLCYDPISSVFSWRVLIDEELKSITSDGPIRPHSAKCSLTKEMINFDRKRSISGPDEEEKDEDTPKEQKQETEVSGTTPELAKHLIKLGFRIPGRESYVDDIKKRTAPLSPRRVQSRSAGTTEYRQRKTKSAGALQIKPSKPYTAGPTRQKLQSNGVSPDTKPVSSSAYAIARRAVKSAAAVRVTSSARYESLCGWDASDKYEDRCLPSVHMRKDVPDSDPLKCCFSLRDNEKLNHKELKDFVKEQVGVEVTGLQYEPLSIRSGDPHIKNRWLATVSNFKDFDWVLEKGLYINNEHVIFKSFDDVMEKEYNKYWYLKQISDETRKLSKPALQKHFKH